MTKVTKVTDVTDVTNVTDVTKVTDMTDVTNLLMKNKEIADDLESCRIKRFDISMVQKQKTIDAQKSTNCRVE